MTTTREEFEAWITSETNVREDAVWHEDKQRYTLLSRKQADWVLWQAAHLAGQRAMQTRAEEVANKTAERILAANTHRGRTSSSTTAGFAAAMKVASASSIPPPESRRR